MEMECIVQNSFGKRMLTACLSTEQKHKILRTLTQSSKKREIQNMSYWFQYSVQKNRK